MKPPQQNGHMRLRLSWEGGGVNSALCHAIFGTRKRNEEKAQFRTRMPLGQSYSVLLGENKHLHVLRRSASG